MKKALLVLLPIICFSCASEASDEVDANAASLADEPSSNPTSTEDVSPLDDSTQTSILDVEYDTGSDGSDGPSDDVAENEESTPRSIVMEDRSGHWLDRPFPHEELQREDGSIDWTILPPAPGVLGALMAAGWAEQASVASKGASHMPAVYFRFTEVFDIETPNVGITGPEGEVIPVEWSWIEDPKGDTFLAPNTLIIIPEHTAPLAANTRYVAWVKSENVESSDNWIPPEGTPDGAVVATAFRTQNSIMELRALGEAVLQETTNNPSLLTPTYFKRVTSLTYTPGTTESGNASTLGVVTFDDGTTSTTFLGSNGEEKDLVINLDETWPFEVWEAEITTMAFQTPTENKPWATSGAGLLADFSLLNEGWIPFVDGKIAHTPEPDSMRIVIQVPRERSGPLPVLLWDHGTGGHAYNAIARTTVGDDYLGVAESLSGAIIISRDQPLYGQRYPLIDEGFGQSLGFYNIGNLPTFRDNQRQGAVDHIITQQFVVDELPDLLADVAEVNTGGVGGFGHSLGSVTLHSALIAQQGAKNTVKQAFMSGSGGYLTYYILSTGLLGTGHDLVDTLSPILGFTPEEVSDFEPHELIGAILGVPAEAWPNVNRKHPVLQLFGTIMDPSDPLMIAPEQTTPETILQGFDDWQVPNMTTEWLGEVLPTDTMLMCQKQADYDGHYCTFREPESFDALRAFIEELAASK